MVRKGSVRDGERYAWIERVQRDAHVAASVVLVVNRRQCRENEYLQGFVFGCLAPDEYVFLCHEVDGFRPISIFIAIVPDDGVCFIQVFDVVGIAPDELFHERFFFASLLPDEEDENAAFVPFGIGVGRCCIGLEDKVLLHFRVWSSPCLKGGEIFSPELLQVVYGLASIQKAQGDGLQGDVRDRGFDRFRFGA